MGVRTEEGAVNKGLSLSGWRVVVGCTADAEVTSGSVLQVWSMSILPSVCSLTVCSAHYMTGTMLSALHIFTHSGLTGPMTLALLLPRLTAENSEVLRGS